VGRPTKYGQDVLDKAYEYLDNFTQHGVVPSTARLARILNVARSQLYVWRDEYPEFQDILEAIQAEQEALLIDSGLTGEFVSPITKLLMTKHGYSDRIEQDMSSSDGSMSPIGIELVGIEPAQRDYGDE
jgi:hypothetical protein